MRKKITYAYRKMEVMNFVNVIIFNGINEIECSRTT